MDIFFSSFRSARQYAYVWGRFFFLSLESCFGVGIARKALWKLMDRSICSDLSTFAELNGLIFGLFAVEQCVFSSSLGPALVLGTAHSDTKL